MPARVRVVSERGRAPELAPRFSARRALGLDPHTRILHGQAVLAGVRRPSGSSRSRSLGGGRERCGTWAVAVRTDLVTASLGTLSLPHDTVCGAWCVARPDPGSTMRASVTSGSFREPPRESVHRHWVHTVVALGYMEVCFLIVSILQVEVQRSN